QHRLSIRIIIFPIPYWFIVLKSYFPLQRAIRVISFKRPFLYPFIMVARKYNRSIPIKIPKISMKDVLIHEKLRYPFNGFKRTIFIDQVVIIIKIEPNKAHRCFFEQGCLSGRVRLLAANEESRK